MDVSKKDIADCPAQSKTESGKYCLLFENSRCYASKNTDSCPVIYWIKKLIYWESAKPYMGDQK